MPQQWKENCLSGTLGAGPGCYKDGENDGAQGKRE